MKFAIRTEAILLISVLSAVGIWHLASPNIDAEKARVSVSEPVVGTAVANAVSRPVRSFSPSAKRSPANLELLETGNSPAPSASAKRSTTSDPASVLDTPMPQPLLSFDGLSNFDNINAYGLVILPPDMNGDVGPRHYVQTVNALARVFDQTGVPLTP
ncbi:MAG TPA: hypothetical protein PLR83_10830, partial [Pyrinomonadaceae bacterium]|nr:hypothetical protein [Pyrinomonadaceae bacterium]